MWWHIGKFVRTDRYGKTTFIRVKQSINAGNSSLLNNNGHSSIFLKGENV